LSPGHLCHLLHDSEHGERPTIRQSCKSKLEQIQQNYGGPATLHIKVSVYSPPPESGGKWPEYHPCFWGSFPFHFYCIP